LGWKPGGIPFGIYKGPCYFCLRDELLPAENFLLHDPAYCSPLNRPGLDNKFIIRKSRLFIINLHPGYIKTEPSLNNPRIIKTDSPKVFIAGIFQIMKIYGIIYMPIGVAFIGANSKCTLMNHDPSIEKSGSQEQEDEVRDAG
jgi:hypothetical protein